MSAKGCMCPVTNRHICELVSCTYDDGSCREQHTEVAKSAHLSRAAPRRRSATNIRAKAKATTAVTNNSMELRPQNAVIDKPARDGETE
jgi:hypothetical protein